VANPIIGTTSSPITVRVTPQPQLQTKVAAAATIPGPMGPTGPQGPRGIPGPAGSGGTSTSAGIVKMSRCPLSSGRVVRFDGDSYCTTVSALTASDALTPMGLAQYAVSAADLTVGITAYGEQEDDSWNFVPGGAVFLGANGFLTQTRGQGWAFLRVIGFAITAQRVFVDPQLPVFLI
jgi:hypothetical protein